MVVAKGSAAPARCFSAARPCVPARPNVRGSGAEKSRLSRVVPKAATFIRLHRLLAESRADARSLPATLLVQATNEMIDASDKRSAAIRNSVPLPVFGILVLVALVGCMVENNRLLDILNKPLAKTEQHGSKDPLVLGAKFDQGMKTYLLSTAASDRAQAAPTSSAPTRPGPAV